MASSVMTFRFPKEIANEIVARSKRTGKDRTAVVVEALAQAFDISLPLPLITVDTLHNQVNQLQGAVNDLSEQVADLQKRVDAKP